MLETIKNYIFRDRQVGSTPTDNEELFQYDTQIINQLNRIEDRITTFAIQNYASSGAVLFAFFTTNPVLSSV
jgi:hypothetical protein